MEQRTLATSAGSPQAWNPKSISGVGVFFTFLPAGILHALNYGRLGYPEKKTPHIVFTIIGFMVFVIVIAEFPFLRKVLLVANLGIAVFYYRSQKLLFEQYLQKGGKPASIRKPMMWALLCLVGLFALLIVGLELRRVAAHRNVVALERKMKPINDHINAIADSTTKVASALRLLSEEGGEHNFAIFFANKEKNYYVQCAGQRGKKEWYCEAVGNENLPATNRLSEANVTRLQSLGWKPPSPENPDSEISKNFYREWKAVDDASRLQIAHEVISALEVYGLSRNQKLVVEVNLE